MLDMTVKYQRHYILYHKHHHDQILITPLPNLMPLPLRGISEPISQLCLVSLEAPRHKELQVVIYSCDFLVKLGGDTKDWTTVFTVQYCNGGVALPKCVTAVSIISSEIWFDTDYDEWHEVWSKVWKYQVYLTIPLSCGAHLHHSLSWATNL